MIRQEVRKMGDLFLLFLILFMIFGPAELATKLIAIVILLAVAFILLLVLDSL